MHKAGSFLSFILLAFGIACQKPPAKGLLTKKIWRETKVMVSPIKKPLASNAISPAISPIPIKMMFLSFIAMAFRCGMKETVRRAVQVFKFINPGLGRLSNYC